jgi:hypothetical protein
LYYLGFWILDAASRIKPSVPKLNFTSLCG